MNRAEAIKALIAGKNIEREANGVVRKMRWSPVFGPEIMINANTPQGHWDIESPSLTPDLEDAYREQWKPRRWGPWEEVRTLAEAESAEDGERFKLMINPIGYDQWILLVVEKDSSTARSFVPVRRAR